MIGLDERRRRVRYRSWHRGTREMDLLLGGFADRHLATMSADDLEAFERLIALPDPDLYAIYRRLEAPPEAVEGPLLNLFLNFKIA
ncbi:MAG: succinate dehydrogenase assembly factor 2 [Alphaproteobacteria bacterium]|nr:succinate dehydrogenase assembly factor 2 [Alphaproteobacteria bacterium]